MIERTSNRTPSSSEDKRIGILYAVLEDSPHMSNELLAHSRSIEEYPKIKINMPPNEYLCLFSNTGNIKVSVKFKDHDGFIANQQMNASEIQQLVSPDGNGFLTDMTFDEWPFEVHQYKIDPIANKLTIFARKIAE